MGDRGKPTGIDIKVRTWPEVERFFARDFAREGLFVPMAEPLSAGAAVALRLRNPEGEHVALAARVARVSVGQRSGVELSLDPIGASAQQQISQWLSRARTAQSPPAAAPQQAAAAPAGAAEARQSLEQLLARLRQDDPFRALGLPSSADARAVKAQYASLVEAYHPHHFSRYGSEVKALSTEAFVQLQKAHRECRKFLSTRGAGSGDRKRPRSHALAADDRAVSQALTLMDLSQWDQAAAALDKALRLDPDNARLRATRKVVDARRSRAAGDAEAARAAYAAVLEIEPGHVEARTQLESLEAEHARNAGLLGRLFKGKR